MSIKELVLEIGMFQFTLYFSILFRILYVLKKNISFIHFNLKFAQKHDYSAKTGKRKILKQGLHSSGKAWRFQASTFFRDDQGGLPVSAAPVNRYSRFCFLRMKISLMLILTMKPCLNRIIMMPSLLHCLKFARSQNIFFLMKCRQ